MQTNLKDALKNADSIKSPMGDVACYSMTKSVADVKKKFDTAYFGWIKFETKSELMPTTVFI